jgi:Raf kinase inhibitor-like YbhB/YbcL family protein
MKYIPHLIIGSIALASSLVIIKGVTMESPSLSLQTQSFTPGKAISKEYTCDGKDRSPSLEWSFSGSPAPQSYLLIVDDPDAIAVVGKTFVHWVTLLSPTTTHLPEGISSKNDSSLKTIDSQAIELVNSFGKKHYGGPCPPPHGGPHQYRFTLFALNIPISTLYDALGDHPITAEQFQKAMKKSIITSAQLVGTYERK